MTLAPIVLFVYNRPEHTLKTLEALQNNKFAMDSTLYVFCDGAKNKATPEQRNRIAKVREIVSSRQWCKKVIITEQNENRGLANSVIAGVGKVFEEHEQVIVLEDDIVTSTAFLSYMNRMLAHYAHHHKVFSVGAYNPIKRERMPVDYDYDVYVSPRFLCWGWGTWRDRWQKAIWTMEYMPQFIGDWNQVRAFNRCGNDIVLMLEKQWKGQIDSWAVRFAYTTFYNKGVALAPCRSYIQNIGTDGSGQHFTKKRNKRKPAEDCLSSVEDIRLLATIKENQKIAKALYENYSNYKNCLKLAIKYLFCNRKK